MELPKFKYSPNAYELDLFKPIQGVCSVCNKQRNWKYVNSFYSIQAPDYICPWCIENGQAAHKYEGDFNDYCGIEGVSPDPMDPEPTIARELLLEITNRTPSYSSYQQEVWLTHCNEPCAFIGYADSKSIEPFLHELQQDIENSGIPAHYITQGLTKDSDLGAYLFECTVCKAHRLHIDYT